MDLSTLQSIEQARALFGLADAAAIDPPPPEPVISEDPLFVPPEVIPFDRRAADLGRLRQYRQATWLSLQAVAPTDAPKNWDALREGANGLGEIAPLSWLRTSSQSPAEDEALEAPALAQVVVQVRDVAAAAVGLAEREHRKRAMGRVQAKRIASLLLGLMVCAVTVVVTVKVFTPVDLAKGKPWRASSSWGTCSPERGRCGSLISRIIFHTLEDDSPWFEIDLQKKEKFSSISVINRKDEDMRSRAVPLVLEASDDAIKWRELARKTEVFLNWTAKFPPTEARYVRARADRKTWLHLEAVKVHP